MKKRKQKKVINAIIIFAVSLLISWYIFNSLVLAIAYSILSVVLTLQIYNKSKKDIKKYNDIESAYNFVNLLNVSMISTNNVYEAYKSVENYVSIDFANIENENLHDQLKEIAEDYDLNSFKMYINTLIIYDNNGGNFKQASSIPTSLCQKCKVYYDKLKKEKKYKLIELTSLYLLWILIISFVRYSLNDFYELMMKDIRYQLLIFIILILGSIFYYQAFLEYFNNKIRGMWYDGKF